MKVVVAPDRLGGEVTAGVAAMSLAAGWRSRRPDDDVVVVAMDAGGAGLLEVVAGPDDERLEVEVAGPLGQPVVATWLRRGTTAVVSAAAACGLDLLDDDHHDPMATTSHGVGELLDHVRTADVSRILVGVGDLATVDGGAGAMTGLGLRLRVDDGSGLKVGGADLGRIEGVAPTWLDAGWGAVEVEVLADGPTTLVDAATVCAPAAGAGEAEVARLDDSLARLATVVERDLAMAGLSRRPGTGAGGGLAFGLAAALGARVRVGAAVVAELVDLDAVLRDADVVVTGQQRLDHIEAAGSVVAHVGGRAHTFAVPMLVVAGTGTAPGDGDWEVAVTVEGPGPATGSAIEATGARLAQQWPA